MSYQFSKEFKESNFTVKEFERSYIADKKGYDNTIPEHLKPNLEKLVLTTLQPLRDALGKPLIVTSGYRCLALNREVGGAKNSKHLYCQAADLKCYLSPTELLELLIKSNIPYTKAIVECSSWLHLTFTGIDSRINYITKDKKVYTKI